MSQRDLIALAISYVCAFGLLLGAEAIRKWRDWPQDFTRKMVHVGAGLWVWGQLALFEHWTIGLIPFASFIGLNYLFYRRQVFQAVDSASSSPGTVYFALSITLLNLLFWRTGGALDWAPVATAGIMAMTLGDAAASIVGRRWGRAGYTVFGAHRTWVGSAAMAVFSLVGIAFTLLVLPGSPLSPSSVPLGVPRALGYAVVGAAIATVAEALSPAGTDNLSVPLATGLTLYLLEII